MEVQVELQAINRREADIFGQVKLADLVAHRAELELLRAVPPEHLGF